MSKRIISAALAAWSSFLPAIAAAASFALPVDASWSGASVTLVVSRAGTQLAAESGLVSQLAGGQYQATATIDLAAAGAGSVDVAAVDAAGNLAAVGRWEIDGAGAVLTTAAARQADAAAAIAAYDPPTAAEFNARTIVAANYATAAAQTTLQAAIDAQPTLSELLLGMVTNDTGVPSPTSGSVADLSQGAGGGSATPIAPTNVVESRTWRPGPSGHKSGNVVTVGRLFSGTLACEPELNPDADIDEINSVTISGPASVTATNLAVTADGRVVHFDVPSLTTAGTYTVTIIVTTKDGQTPPMECILIVE